MKAKIISLVSRAGLMMACSLSLSVIVSVFPSYALASTPTYAWTQQSFHLGGADFRGISSSADGVNLAVTDVDREEIDTSSTTGATWIEQTSASDFFYTISSSADGTHLVAAGDLAGALWTSTNSGVTWTKQISIASSSNWVSVTNSATNGSVIAGVVHGGDIYVSSSTGATWTDVTSSGGLHNLNWTGIHASADGTTLAAVVQNGDIYVSTTTGATWTDVTSSGALHNLNWSAVVVPDNTHIAAAAQNGDIYVSTTTGATWTDATVSGVAHNQAWNSLTSSSNGSVIVGAAGSGGDIYASADGGSTWADITSTGSVHGLGWASVAASSDGTKLAASGLHIWTGTLDNITASVATPSANSSVSGTSVPLQATVTDAVTSTGPISFYVDGSLVGTGSSPSYTYTWNSQTVGNGTHTLYGVVQSSAGMYATTTTVTFTVNNPIVSSGGSSVTQQVQNLEAMGNTAKADELKAQWHQLFSSSAPTASTTAMPPVSTTLFTRNLERGASGSDVTALQKFLIAAKAGKAAQELASAGTSTYFGSLTKAALIEYQKAHNISPASGYLGSITRAYIASH